MLLKDYIDHFKINKKEFAEEIGLTYTHLINILNGVKNITPKNAAIIEKATLGHVSRMEALYPEEFQQVERFGVQYLFLRCPIKITDDKK